MPAVHHPVTSLYRVEVSGWDDRESFFVEKSELEWGEDSGKHVTLNHRIRNGSILFVRLLQPTSVDKSNSVAYEAEFLGATPTGSHQFQLRSVSPRVSTGEEDPHQW